jgi:RNA polymerase sigma-70 factor (ECF subfamily)
MSESLVERFEDQCLVHLDSVYRMARRLAHDDAEAEDLVQDTLVRAFRAFDRFELREYGVKPWLFKILHNTFYTHRGQTRRQPTLLDGVSFDKFTAEDGSTSEADGIENIDWEAIDEELKEAVEALQPEYQLVLLLWSFEDLSYKEIADVCDCPVGTVMSRLYRARQQLGDRLKEFAEHRNIPKKA